MNIDKLCAECEDCSQKSSLFEVLTADELKYINRDRYSVRFRKGEVILKQGTRADSLISMIEGFAKMYIEGHNDRNIILEFIKPWELVGAPCVYASGKHRYSVVAVQETLVCFIDATKYKKVVAANSQFCERVLIHCSNHYLNAIERMVGLTQKQMHGRIADALIYLSRDVYDSHVIGDDITRQDMADITSMTKDSAIRILKELERDGIITLDGKRIRVLDPEKLHDISMKG